MKTVASPAACTLRGRFFGAATGAPHRTSIYEAVASDSMHCCPFQIAHPLWLDGTSQYLPVICLGRLGWLDQLSMEGAAMAFHSHPLQLRRMPGDDQAKAMGVEARGRQRNFTSNPSSSSISRLASTAEAEHKSNLAWDD